MKSCLVVTGGRIDPAFARPYLETETFDKIIAVDGGLEAADALGLMPDYIVGDFDTARRPVLEKYRAFPFIVWEVHKPEKNETDTELARSLALQLGCSRLVFLGATGGRLDHMLGNVDALLACLENGVEAYLVDAQNRIRLIDGETQFSRGAQWGRYVSFLPYTEEVRGITLEGFKYPLCQKDIRKGNEVGLCISNEITAPTARVTFTEGILICVESRD